MCRIHSHTDRTGKGWRLSMRLAESKAFTTISVTLVSDSTLYLSFTFSIPCHICKRFKKTCHQWSCWANHFVSFHWEKLLHSGIVNKLSKNKPGVMATLPQMSIHAFKAKIAVASQRPPWMHKLLKVYYHVYIHCTYLDWIKLSH